MDRSIKLFFIGLLALAGWVARADQTIFQPTIYSTGSSLTIQSGITATFASGSTVNFTGATVIGLPSGGTPGGANTNVQYNASGVFGGDANLTWDNTGGGLSLTNSAAGSGAIAQYLAKNGAQTGTFGLTGTGYNPSGVFLPGQMFMYNSGPNGIAIAAGAGSASIRFATNGTAQTAMLDAVGVFSFGSTPDIGFSRNAAGVLEINNATAGQYRDLIVRNLTVNGTCTGCGTGGGGAPTTSTYVTQTPDATLTSELALSTLATGLLKSTTTTGALATITDNSTNWNTAFTQTRQWDGGSTGLTAATGRTSLALDQVTNNAQTQAAIVPNTAPTAGQILIGNAGGTAYAKQTVTNASLSATGVLTGVANAALTNSAITIAGTSTSLGGTITQDTITGLSATGIVKRTAANTLAIATAGTDYMATSTNVAASQMPALTGDVTTTAGTVATTIAANAVTYAKMQNTAAAGVLLGRTSASAGVPQEITVGGGNYMSGTTLISKATANADTASIANNGIDGYLPGSMITVTAGDFTAGTSYHCLIHTSKTGVGTAAIITTVRMGTLGGISDPAILTFTQVAGSAVVDTGTLDHWVTFKSVGAGTSAVLFGVCNMVHGLTNTGLFSTGTLGTAAVGGLVTSSGFNSTTPTKIGISYNSGSAGAHTVTVLRAELVRP